MAVRFSGVESDADWTASVCDQPARYSIVSEPILPASYRPPDVHLCAKSDASCPHLV